jgi:ferric-dicitrate binding protein FerR (iron transport regulator)
MREEIIIAYLKNDLLPKEKTEVDKWIQASDANKKYFNKYKFIWENSGSDHSGIRVDKNEAWDKIQSAIRTEGSPGKKYFTVSINSFARIAAAAVILFGIGFSSYMTIRNSQSTTVEWESVQTTDEKADIILPDNSHIWLNNNSEITFPAKFKGNSRKIRLNGEAYFEVAKKKWKPFIISVGEVSVEVLGTSFNVEARNVKSLTSVIVASGRVALYKDSDRKNRIIIAPGEKGTYNNSSGQIALQKNSKLNFLAWKTGILMFENTELKEVCQVLSGHFKIPITLDAGGNPEEKNLTAVYDNKGFEDILNILALTLDLDYRVENNAVVLYVNQESR